MSDSSDRFKGSTTTTAAPGRYSLGVRAQRLLGCHKKGQADSGMGVTTTACQRLVLTTSMVVRRYIALNVIFIMFGKLCISGEPLLKFRFFLK